MFWVRWIRHWPRKQPETALRLRRRPQRPATTTSTMTTPDDALESARNESGRRTTQRHPDKKITYIHRALDNEWR